MRLLLIEDEVDFVTLLAKGMRQQGYAVDVALDGEQGWQFALSHDYDLVILDLNLPKLNGLEVCRRIRVAKPHVLILMLTARGLPEESVVGLDAGADDYVTKPFHFGELTARVRALLRRERQAIEPLLQYKDLRLDPASQTVWHGKQPLPLTRKEFGLLAYLMRHQGKVVSQEVLLEHVWDADTDPLTSTVRVHVNSLRRKLGDDVAAPRYIETVIGAGYRLGRPRRGNSL